MGHSSCPESYCGFSAPLNENPNALCLYVCLSRLNHWDGRILDPDVGKLFKETLWPDPVRGTSVSAMEYREGSGKMRPRPTRERYERIR